MPREPSAAPSPFGVPREVAFDYLVDPRNRAEWQSSLARVSEVDGEPRLGQTWVDETKPGLKPLMRTTELERPSHWSETGTWRFVRADLTLDLAEAPGGCTVAYRFRDPRPRAGGLGGERALVAGGGGRPAARGRLLVSPVTGW